MYYNTNNETTPNCDNYLSLMNVQDIWAIFWIFSLSPAAENKLQNY